MSIFTHPTRLVCALCFVFSAAVVLRSEAIEVEHATKRTFDVPAGDAPVALKQFAQQSGLELLYSTRAIEGAKTNPVKGELTVHEALKRLLSGTNLIATPGKNRGAFAVTRTPDPNESRAPPTETGDRP